MLTRQECVDITTCQQCPHATQTEDVCRACFMDITEYLKRPLEHLERIPIEILCLKGDYGDYLVSRCNDSTLWQWICGAWKQFPPIPQPEKNND